MKGEVSDVCEDEVPPALSPAHPVGVFCRRSEVARLFISTTVWQDEGLKDRVCRYKGVER